MGTYTIFYLIEHPLTQFVNRSKQNNELQGTLLARTGISDGTSPGGITGRPFYDFVVSLFVVVVTYH